MGIRNSFGLAVDPHTGYLWETENGPDYFDEINLVKPGFNSGYKIVMGPIDEKFFQKGCINTDFAAKKIREWQDDPNLALEDIPTGTVTCNSQSSPVFENFEYSDPEFSWHRTVAPSAIAFPDNDSFSAYSDSLFVGDFNNGRIYNFQLNSDRTGFVFYNQELSDLVLDYNDNIDEILFASDFPGITDIKFHDNAMYVVAFGDGSIYKIYSRSDVLPPLKQYQNGVSHKKIVCMQSLMPIMSKSGYIYCVQPKTAITLNNVLDWSIDHPEMPQIQLKNQDLQGLNFEHLNLSNSNFKKAKFDTAKISNVNFTGANLSYTNLSSHDLTGTILRGADLSHTIIIGADLSGVDLTGTILKGSNLSNSDLTGVDLTGVDLTGVNLIGVDLSGKDLTGTIFWKVKFLDVNLDSANLSNADLRDTLLVDAYLSNTTLTGSDLTGAILTGAILTGADLANSVLTGAILNCVGHHICVS